MIALIPTYPLLHVILHYRCVIRSFPPSSPVGTDSLIISSGLYNPDLTRSEIGIRRDLHARFARVRATSVKCNFIALLASSVIYRIQSAVSPNTRIRIKRQSMRWTRGIVISFTRESKWRRCGRLIHPWRKINPWAGERSRLRDFFARQPSLLFVVKWGKSEVCFKKM